MFSMLHDQLGHRALCSLLAADEHHVWADTKIHIESESNCTTCKIATICATARNKHPHTPAGHPGHTVFMYIIPCKSCPGITPKSSFAYGLLLVNSFSCFSALYGLDDESTACTINTILQCAADYRMADNFGYIDIERIQADAGSEFTSGPFCDFCKENSINLSLTAPNQQDNNYFTERSWQTIHQLARSMMVHACLPDKCHYHAIRYATSMFNILLIQGSTNNGGEPCTPYELFCNKKPTIAHFRVLLAR